MIKERIIIWHNDRIKIKPELSSKIGGKALGLHILKSLYRNVPVWGTFTTDFYKSVLLQDKKFIEIIGTDYFDYKQKASVLREYISKFDFDAEYLRKLKKIWKKISNKEKQTVAVRSSASDEDGAKLSFAGQMDSFLNVSSFEQFINSLKLCWASLFGERVVLYRMQNKIDPWDVNIAVVVQQMIEADVSGVVFSVNPLNSKPDELLITSTFGLGEGLVSGNLDADTFVVNPKGKILKTEIGQKKQAVVFSVEGGTVYQDVDNIDSNIATLNQKQIKKLTKLSLLVARERELPQDIEFSIKHNKIYLLQSRPITSLKKDENFKVWDNSNIVESYSGVTTPLTFSFIRKAYFAVYWQFCQTLGIDEKTIFKNRNIYENMLGLIKGRVYYNLLNWYKLISLMPGFEYNKKFMEQMMGVQVTADFDCMKKPKSIFEKYFVELPKLVKVGFKMWQAHKLLPKSIEAFHQNFNKVYSLYSKMDFEAMPPYELMKVYRNLEDEVLWQWKAPITNDFEAMIFYGLLKSLTLKWNIDVDGSLQNDLLCGQGNIKSTQVTTQLFYIARDIEKDSILKQKFLEVNPEDAYNRLRFDAEFKPIYGKFVDYLQEYGVRCINEMKLESIPIKDNPIFCIAMIQNYLRNTVVDPDKQAEHENQIRSKAELELKNKLRGESFLLIFDKIDVYNWVLKNARWAIRNRENQRFARTQAYSLIRNIFRSIGKNWQTKGVLDASEDIFYLTIDEIWSCIEGTSVCVNIKELISLRKKEFESYLQENPDDHIETNGDVYFENIFKKDVIENSKSDLLKGLGCCPGILEKEVRVVLKPDNDLKLNGEIMVAKQTDPGWIVLFPSISGLIVEKGSMLSHSAIVAREMGIPAVVGVKNATAILQSGDRVILNGAAGTIKILPK